MKTFEQRHFFKKQLYSIEENGVLVVILGVFGRKKAKYVVPFEEISDSIYESREERQRYVIIVIISAFSFIKGFSYVSDYNGEGLIIPFILISILLILAVFLYLNANYGIVGFKKTNLYFFDRDKDSPEVAEFISHIKKAKYAYLLEHYPPLEYQSTVTDELHHLLWLKNQGAINQDEFDLLKKKIIEQNDDKPRNAIGFK
jgi:hypothetical protein